MILLLDSYDSFAYNISAALQVYNQKVMVVHHDAVNINELLNSHLSGIVLGPGPKAPAQIPNLNLVLETFKNRLPILGVCLGHQAIALHFGGSIKPAIKPRHGKTTPINHNGQGLFGQLPKPLTAMRYHSLVVGLPAHCPLNITAKTSEGEIMATQHKKLAISSVQFHPDSILTQQGQQIFKNWLMMNNLL